MATTTTSVTNRSPVEQSQVIEPASRPTKKAAARYALLESLDLLPAINIELINSYLGSVKVPQDARAHTLGDLLQRKFVHSIPISIIEARDSHLSRKAIHSALMQMTEKELGTDVTRYNCAKYLTKAYYDKREISYPYQIPENILLVQSEEQIIGFLIGKIVKHHDGHRTYDERAYFVVRLAISSTYQGKGLGTQLMLTAMSKAHALRLPLTLVYIDYPTHETGAPFFNSFTRKFGIPMHNEKECGMCFPIWDLRKVEALTKED
ncbi:MAG TPA: GNAT family N-acetyltransferase [Rhabdochlamydiaceae bacterium]